MAVATILFLYGNYYFELVGDLTLRYESRVFYYIVPAVAIAVIVIITSVFAFLFFQKTLDDAVAVSAKMILQYVASCIGFLILLFLIWNLSKVIFFLAAFRFIGLSSGNMPFDYADNILLIHNVTILLVNLSVSVILARFSFVFPLVHLGQGVSFRTAFKRSRKYGWPMLRPFAFCMVLYWIVFMILPLSTDYLLGRILIGELRLPYLVLRSLFASALILFSLSIVASAFNQTSRAALNEIWD